MFMTHNNCDHMVGRRGGHEFMIHLLGVCSIKKRLSMNWNGTVMIRCGGAWLTSVQPICQGEEMLGYPPNI